MIWERRGTSGRSWGLDDLLTAGLIGYAAVYASWLLLRWGGQDQQVAIADGIYLPLGILVVAIALRAARSAQQRSVRRAWCFFAAAFAAYAMADFAWFHIEVIEGLEVPTPSLADVGYLAFYPLMVLGLLALPREAPGSDRTRLLDLAIVCTASVASVWWLVVGPIAAAIGSDPEQGSSPWPIRSATCSSCSRWRRRCWDESAACPRRRSSCLGSGSSATWSPT